MITHIKLYHFRSYGLYETTLAPGGTVIVGPNGTGKTNLLEAIYVALRGSSFRGSLADCMQHDQTQTIIHLETDNASRRLQLLRTADGTINKEFTINDSRSKLLPRKHRLPVVLFEPSELRLISSSPSRRRDFLDGILSRLDAQYEATLRAFHRTLLQRNELLKHPRETTQNWRDHLFAWDIKFVQLATHIAQARATFLAKHETALSSLYAALAGHETAFAASVQESRPILTGVHFVLTDNRSLKTVATDSHRMSQKKITLEKNGDNFDVVIPSRSLREFTAVFTDEIETVEVFFANNQILFRSENISFYTRLLEGNYPDTDRLIPTEFTSVLTFNTSDLRAAMERARLLSNATQNGTVKLEIAGGIVSAHVNSPEVGRVNEEIDTESVTGEDLTISFNPTYLIDALKAIDSEKVTISFISSVRPFTLVPSEDTENFIQLITPVRTN